MTPDTIGKGRYHHHHEQQQKQHTFCCKHPTPTSSFSVYRSSLQAHYSLNFEEGKEYRHMWLRFGVEENSKLKSRQWGKDHAALMHIEYMTTPLRCRTQCGVMDRVTV